MFNTTDHTALSDAELILLLKQGNRIAYTEIFDRYYYIAITQAYKKLQDEDQAKDIIQDLFTDLWYKKESLPIVNNLTGYILTALRNRILNFYEHQKVEIKHIESLKDYINTGNIAHTDYLIREKEQKAYIESAIQSLPSKMREIFELSRKNHLTHKQIAQHLSLSERTVNAQILNALSRIKQKLNSIITPFL